MDFLLCFSSFTAGLKQMIEKLPDDRFFIDILKKFKHSFNLLGELKHIIHNPNAPELIHYLLSPLQFILYTLRTKHVNQIQLAQEIWTPALTKEARDLLLNCLTSKEHEILRNLGPAWIRPMYVADRLDWGKREKNNENSFVILVMILFRNFPIIDQYFSKVEPFGLRMDPWRILAFHWRIEA